MRGRARWGSTLTDGGGAQALTVGSAAAPGPAQGLTQVDGGPADALTVRSGAASDRGKRTAESGSTLGDGGQVDALTVRSVAAPERGEQTAGSVPSRVMSLAWGRPGPWSA